MAGPFEDKPGASSHETTDFSTALRAFRKGVFCHALTPLKGKTAGFAFIFIGRHYPFLLTFREIILVMIAEFNLGNDRFSRSDPVPPLDQHVDVRIRQIDIQP